MRFHVSSSNKSEKRKYRDFRFISVTRQPFSPEMGNASGPVCCQEYFQAPGECRVRCSRTEAEDLVHTRSHILLYSPEGSGLRYHMREYYMQGRFQSFKYDLPSWAQLLYHQGGTFPQ